MTYRRRLMYDGTPEYEITEGTNWFLNICNERGPITARSRLIENVSIDFLCESIAVTAMIENPDNLGVGDLVGTTRYKMTIRDTLSGGWIFTAGNTLAEMTPIPGNLIAGTKPTPLPAPKSLMQNNQVEIIVEPCGYDICYFSVTLFGRRMDTLPQWERDLVCGDPRTSGPYWMYFDPTEIERGDSPADLCGKGPTEINTLRVPTLPFDFFAIGAGGFMADPSNECVPIGRAFGEFKLTDMNNKKTLMQKFSPTSILGGTVPCATDLVPNLVIPCDGEQVCEYYARYMSFYTAWRIRSQSAIELQVRSVWSPMDVTLFPTQLFQLILVGMKVPTDEIAIGFPYYNRQDGSLRCPPGSDGQLPGYPGGPCPPYIGGPAPAGYQQQLPPPGYPPQQRGPNPGLGSINYGNMMNHKYRKGGNQ